jgi:chemotaxis protein MotB
MSNNSNDKRPIIIRKKVTSHAGHHGGAWKVAYADFVTAMMAFFMVMWIMGMDPQAKDLIQGYFQNPVGFKKGFGGGANPLSAGNSIEHEGIRAAMMALREAQRGNFAEVAERIRLRLAKDDQLNEIANNFEIKVTNEGLRIELIDAGKGDVFFAVGSPAPKEILQHALELIGAELKTVPNPVVIEGHTDARQYGKGTYSNWELSVDRANVARRLVVAAGVEPDRIKEVRGLADRDPRVPGNPLDPANRRVTLLIPFVENVPKVPVIVSDSALASNEPFVPPIRSQTAAGGGGQD